MPAAHRPKRGAERGSRRNPVVDDDDDAATTLARLATAVEALVALPRFP